MKNVIVTYNNIQTTIENIGYIEVNQDKFLVLKTEDRETIAIFKSWDYYYITKHNS